MLKVVHGFVDSKRMICFCMACAMLSVALISFGAHATNPQSVDYNVYVKPSLNISVSSNSVVLNINPAGSLNGSNNPNNFASNSLNVSVATNNQYGYKLYLATENNTTDLVRNQDPENTGTDDGISGTIPTLDTTTTESDFPYNKWGYKQDSETNYKPFQSNTLISSSTIATNEQTSQLTFGAKANYDKPAGQYELDLNFKALPTVTTYYMQDIAKDPTLAESVCTEEPTVVIDKRDEKAYTIRRIGGDATHPGDCWMVENLQFTGTELDSTTSNVAPNYTPSNPYRVNNGEGYHSLTLGSDYNDARIAEGNVSTKSPIDDNISNTIHNVWYNYAAASAGTITGSSNADPQIYDVCPAGWRLPNTPEIRSIISHGTEFSATIGGHYGAGTIISESTGWWWASNAYTTASHRDLYYDGTSYSIGQSDRRYGFSVRCVLDGANINNLTYMQDFAKLNETNNSAKKQQVIASMESNGGSYTLKDIRDSRDYSVRKLGPDGSQNIWMTDNLMYGYTSASSQTTATMSVPAATSDVNSDKSFTTYDLVYYGTNTSGKNNCYATAESGAGYTYSCIHSGTVAASATLTNVATPTVWYNYATATANTIKNAIDGTTPQVTETICPKGWTMPTRDQEDLISGTTYNTVDRLNPIFGGGWNNAIAYSPSYGFYWAKPHFDSGQRYYLYGTKTSSLTIGHDRRPLGFYLRCVAR